MTPVNQDALSEDKKNTANALIGVHRALLDHVRRRVQAGGNPAGLAAEVRKLTTDAFELLEQGVGRLRRQARGQHRRNASVLKIGT